MLGGVERGVRRVSDDLGLEMGLGGQGMVSLSSSPSSSPQLWLARQGPEPQWHMAGWWRVTVEAGSGWAGGTDALPKMRWRGDLGEGNGAAVWRRCGRCELTIYWVEVESRVC